MFNVYIQYMYLDKSVLLFDIYYSDNLRLKMLVALFMPTTAKQVFVHVHVNMVTFDLSFPGAVQVSQVFFISAK